MDKDTISIPFSRSEIFALWRVLGIMIERHEDEIDKGDVGPLKWATERIFKGAIELTEARKKILGQT